MIYNPTSYIEKLRIVREAEWEVLREVLVNLSPGRLLEVGSRDAFMAKKYASLGWKVIGIDINPAATEPGDPTILYGDAHALGFSSGTFDCVVFPHSYLSFEDPNRALSEAHRVLNERGVLIVWITSQLWLVLRILLYKVAYFKNRIFNPRECSMRGSLPPAHSTRYRNAVEEALDVNIKKIKADLWVNNFSVKEVKPTCFFMPPECNFFIKPRRMGLIASSYVIVAVKS